MNIYKQLRLKKNLTQIELSDKLNVTQATISKWEKGKSIPDIMTLKTLAEFFNVSIEYLLGQETSKLSTKETRIPVLGRIPAGIPIEMIEDVLDYEELKPEMLIGDKKYFALKVKGDSMMPKFQEGDVLIVRQQDDCENGAYAIVAVNGDDATFKKVIKRENGIILQPLNTIYEPIIFDKKQIETLPVRILGVVVEIRRSI